jgi:hypothetical protein
VQVVDVRLHRQVTRATELHLGGVLQGGEVADREKSERKDAEAEQVHPERAAFGLAALEDHEGGDDPEEDERGDGRGEHDRPIERRAPPRDLTAVRCARRLGDSDEPHSGYFFSDLTCATSAVTSASDSFG